jgi:hypothetical protein
VRPITTISGSQLSGLMAASTLTLIEKRIKHDIKRFIITDTLSLVVFSAAEMSFRRIGRVGCALQADFFVFVDLSVKWNTYKTCPLPPAKAKRLFRIPSSWSCRSTISRLGMREGPAFLGRTESSAIAI